MAQVEVPMENKAMETAVYWSTRPIICNGTQLAPETFVHRKFRKEYRSLVLASGNNATDRGLLSLGARYPSKKNA